MNYFILWLALIFDSEKLYHKKEEVTLFWLQYIICEVFVCLFFGFFVLFCFAKARINVWASVVERSPLTCMRELFLQSNTQQSVQTLARHYNGLLQHATVKRQHTLPSTAAHSLAFVPKVDRLNVLCLQVFNSPSQKDSHLFALHTAGIKKKLIYIYSIWSCRK